MNRVVIGETYFFDDGKGGGHVGTVTSAIVIDPKREAWVSVTGPDGNSSIHRQFMSESAYADYKAHPDAYFGKIQAVGCDTKDLYDFFERLMEANATQSRAFLLAELSKVPEPGGFDHLSDDELRALYCEMVAGALDRKRRSSGSGEIGHPGMQNENARDKPGHDDSEF